MKTVEVRLPDEIADKIARVAEQRGLSVGDLLRVSVEEKLARDAEFNEAARGVLTKNAELYKRLA